MEIGASVHLNQLNPRTLMIRGVFSLLCGLLGWLITSPGLVAVALGCGVYIFGDGVLTAATGWRRGRPQEAWGLPLLQGAVAVTLGVLPTLAPLAILALVSSFAVISGVLLVFQGRRLLKDARAFRQEVNEISRAA
jgi:uncharacterized membrane protein HdeD (DUF308 family)